MSTLSDEPSLQLADCSNQKQLFFLLLEAANHHLRAISTPKPALIVWNFLLNP